MTWEEMKKFTWEEAGNFTWQDLQLSANELYEKVKNDNTPMSAGTVEKLQELCKELPEEVPLPKNKYSMKDWLNMINTILAIVKATSDMAEKCKPIAAKILEIIIDTYHSLS